MRNIITGTIETACFLALDFRDGARSHFDMFFELETNALNSIYFRMPWTRVELFVERSNVNVGFGYERASGNVEFFLGKVRGVVSIETKVETQAV
ncbi:hypothetical protein ATU3B_04340 [Agrobacterium genomosp. 3 str. CIP 111-78]|uniref:Uncharacterized protein n=1 Tax=Agrobacterium tumefaciens TaxID=358 RepID=A0AAE6EMF1_AGRTU|nr:MULTISPECIES: hypothetical protein [Agrobacterium tumefaciens complex]MCA2370845.1 hypothetical protein [Agrobacterium tomkonis CIP 111-78]QCM02611.1 hypothetical protein CFBP6624_20835 [Agrobacterium tumefaciens]